jgi:hypothetical protein
MGKAILSSVVRFLFLAVVIGFPGLSVAEPTSSATPTDENTALVAKINSLYYNYKNLGLHKFKCEVKISMFDNILKMLQDKLKKDDKRFNALKDIRFFINYDEKNGYQLNYSNYKPTGDSKIDNDIARILDGSSKIVGGFWSSWQTVVFEPTIDSSKASVTVRKTGSGYEITEKKGSSLGKNILDKDLLVTEVDGSNADKPDMSVAVKPVFVKTTDGLLINSMTVTVPKYMNETINIDYQDIQKYKLPAKVEISVDMLGSMKTDVALQFLNFQLN